MAKILSMTMKNPNMSSTRTYEDFSKMIGMKPHRFGIIARMFENHTSEYITEGLGNVFVKDWKKSRFLSVNTLMYDWEVETNDIKRVRMTSAPVGTGANASEITMTFEENYYQMNDTFQIEDTKQQFFVVGGPIRRADNEWELQVRIISDNFNETLDTCAANASTRWIGNALNNSYPLFILVEAVLGN